MRDILHAALKVIMGIMIVPLAVALAFLWPKLEKSKEAPWWKKAGLWIVAGALFIIVAPLYPRWEKF